MTGGGGGVPLLQTWALCGFLFLSLLASKNAGASFIISSTSLLPRRTEHGLHLPIFKRAVSTSTKGNVRRGEMTGNTGLGDFLDVTYTVVVTIGGISTPLVLDTGSSDLWVISDACSSCSRTVPFYPQSTFQPVPGLSALLYYGDSLTGTHAFGLIGRDTVNLAGLRVTNQHFAAINDTSTSVTDTGAAGIFGLGFAVNSVIWRELFPTVSRLGVERDFRSLLDSSSSRQLNRYDFPDLTSLAERYPNTDPHPTFNATVLVHSQLASPPTASFTHALFSSFAKTGPFLGRLVATSALAAPHFTITLRRDTVDVGGNDGFLSIGELPPGINEGNLTWAKVRSYSASEGGLPPPANSPGEQYPIAWEVFIDDVYLDGVKLSRSNLSSSSIALSALVDTGNSLVRGPADVVRTIQTILSSTFPSLPPHFPCSEPHTLTFQIGGRMFPIDPRDLVRQEFDNSVQWCRANLEVTDPPSKYLYSWSLGDPFLKSVLATFYYGNLTYPSRDPPKVGFLSTVPRDAEERLKAAVEAARSNGGNFAATSERAPVVQGTQTGAVQATSTSRPTSSASRHGGSWIAWIWVGTVLVCPLVM